jgi:hypothetical protein
MLEQIHTPTEDMRVTRMIVALSTMAFAVFTLAAAAM